MHRFSTPEEVFGPVSITELKNDNFLRKTEGFLPQAAFAFLDEIWKSSPAILNSLLTIINEKLFRNGTTVETAPLKALVAASNETPPPGQGLEALYDRFLVRLNVPPVEGKERFENVLKSEPTRPKLKLPDDVVIQEKEWEEWRNEIHLVDLSEETLNIIHDIRRSFEEKGEEFNLYISDRRWQKAAILLKAAAFFNGRDKTNLVDTLLLRHCLWTTEENYTTVAKIVEDAVRRCGFETGLSLNKIDSEKAGLEREINKELYHSKDVYKTENLHGKEYFKCIRLLAEERTTFYIIKNKMKSTDKFCPVDKQGNELKWIKCCFDGHGSCSIQSNVRGKHADSHYLRYSDYWRDQNPFTPEVLFHKGEKKTDVNSRLIASLQEAVFELTKNIDDITKRIEVKLEQFKKELETPFVLENTRSIALEGVIDQLQDIMLRRKDCDRLNSLIEKT